MSKAHTPVPKVSNDDIARYLGGIGDDTRRAILRSLGLPKRRQHAVSELWAALGLEPEQPKKVRKYLIPDPEGRNALWGAARVAEETGVVRATVNDWCARKAFPQGFPPPLIDHRRKTRLWLPIEVRAYIEPSIYGDIARRIRRRPKAVEKPARPEPVAWHGTLQPLPPVDAGASK